MALNGNKTSHIYIHRCKRCKALQAMLFELGYEALQRCTHPFRGVQCNAYPGHLKN